MEKLYGVYHVYDVDGGFGDAVSCCDLIGTTTSKEDAEEFVRKYNNPHVYSSPYDDLMCHELIIQELKSLNLSENPFTDSYFNDYVEED